MSTTMRKLLELVAGEGGKRGKVQVIDVLHDDRCPCLHGRECRCDPDIRVNGRPMPEKLRRHEP